ncbi:MAG: hypothetical protein DME22_00885 [Verrucomicrobia bacterium]|nr:MAG: hypothetical protein DME22_00885 [Verrucomicrobiota bacterium]
MDAQNLVRFVSEVECEERFSVAAAILAALEGGIRRRQAASRFPVLISRPERTPGFSAIRKWPDELRSLFLRAGCPALRQARRLPLRR